MGEGRSVNRVLVGRPEETTGKTYASVEDNIKMDLIEMGIDGANWIPLAQDRVQ
jgi:hypothetical protein